MQYEQVAKKKEENKAVVFILFRKKSVVSKIKTKYRN